MSHLHPHFHLKYALEGRIVTMDPDNTIIDRGRIFINEGEIVDIRPKSEGYPPGFSCKSVILSGGTIYPGLIELHNHLPYNILPFWISERKFDNHTQWKGIQGYKVNVQGPMQTLGRTNGFPEAIVKYVECKCLVSGVTASQGVTLYRSHIRKSFFHGTIRNVEETNEQGLPEVQTKIEDVKPGKAEEFLNGRQPGKTTLLHLSEGIDHKARSFFQNLKLENDDWAINNRLNGIHCTGLLEEDFEIFSKCGGTMTWSPFSNLLLYGKTANIIAAKESGILMALGSDWSPSGSKNLLEELKVAKEVSRHQGGVFTDEEIVRMVTINPAKILGWDQSLGSIEVGKKADLVVVNGYGEDPYEKLIQATERNVFGVIINGVPRYATTRLMRTFSTRFNFDEQDKDELVIKDTKRVMYTLESDPNNLLKGIKFKDARDKLKGGLQNILQHALELEEASENGFITGTENPLQLDWILMPDFHHEHLDTDSGEFEWGTTVKYSKVASPLPLDGLAVIDDNEHFSRLRNQPNLPEYLREHLPKYYDRPPLGSEQKSFAPSSETHESLDIAVTLEMFKKRSSNLSRKEKLLILNQAQTIMERLYVHRVLKQSLYAVNPVQRLEKMIDCMHFNLSERYNNDNNFHYELLKIFSSLRDLHTKYYLPNPYKNRFAFLPFLIEQFYEFEEDDSPKYIVTKTFDTIIPKPSFQAGVEVLLWNNTPIERIIELNAEGQSGSNQEAQTARSIDTLTIRSLASSPPPDENSVELTCRDEAGEIFKVTYEWLVSFYPPQKLINPDNNLEQSMVFAGDLNTLSVNNVKLGFYILGREKEKHQGWVLPSTHQSMRGRMISSKGHGNVGYIRIFNFSTPDEHVFTDHFLKILDELKQSKIEGLIIDIRGNGGGSIPACELLLAKLAGQNFKAQSFQFLSSGLTLELTNSNTGADGMADLSPWNESLRKSKSTGELYSLGAPISKFVKSPHAQKVFSKKMLLITDALCYSAADIFAAGFKDLRIGKILGINGNTGAGGANVWNHEVIRKLYNHNRSPEQFFPSLPDGADLTCAVRRTLRENGTPLEDFGVIPDFQHRMTKVDLLDGNRDLIDHAIGRLFGE